MAELNMSLLCLQRLDGHWVTARIPVDLIFSLPMFLRLYLICRTMLLHSI